MIANVDGKYAGALYSAKDFLEGRKGTKSVGRCSDPDRPGPLMVDLKTLEELCKAGKKN